jgi:hypothetical protein
MMRELAMAAVLGMGLATAAAAQQSVMASAVVLEQVEPDVRQVEVRSSDGRMILSEAGAEVQPAQTRLLRSTFVNAGVGAVEATVPFRIREEGTLRLERRGVPQHVSGERLEDGESLLIDVVEQLTVTRIIASNS